MEVQLPEERKKQYDNMLKGIQDIESSIGSSQYRIHKLMNLREDLDRAIKGWWDDCLKDLSLDPKLDYMINKEGAIQDVPRKTPEVTQPITVSDLK
jgi:hypothetical protein